MTRAIATTTGPVKVDALAPAAGLKAMLRSAGAAARTSQTIGIEWMYFTRTAMAQSTEAAKKLSKAGSLATALEIQAAYAKGAYERFTAQAVTFRDLYATLATDMAKPFESMAPRKAV